MASIVVLDSTTDPSGCRRLGDPSHRLSRFAIRAQRARGPTCRTRTLKSGYGLWTLVVLNSAIFIFFAFSFARPRSSRDWRNLGAFAAFIIAGFLMLASAWRVLHQAQQHKELAVDGLYTRMKHPQYVAFFIIIFGFLRQWPALPTLVMLVVVSVRLARLEKKSALDASGATYHGYMAQTPAFFPARRHAALENA